MIDFRAMALDILSKNPNIAKDPQAQEMVNVIKSGDNKRGEELARNLCMSRGISPEQATDEAKKFFKLG